MDVKRAVGGRISYKKACALILKREYGTSVIFQLEMATIYGKIPQVQISALYRIKKVLFTILCPIYSHDTPIVVGTRMTHARNLLRVNYPLIPKV